MRLISSVSWVKRGASQTPQVVRLEKNEMKSLFSELGAGGGDGKNKDDSDQEEEEDDDKESTTSDRSKSVDRKYNMDNYDEEDEDIRIEPLNSLACYASNQEDALLSRKDDGEDSDGEDLEISLSDNLIVCGTINGDDSSLDIYVYNEENGQFYIHHDILLSSMPVCLEWLDFDPNPSDSPVNLLAVGSLNPWIEIWDLNIMESLECDFVLGDMNAKKKLKKIKKMEDEEEKKKARNKIRGHTDSVVCLSSNPNDRSELASGSADKSVLFWDLNEMKRKSALKSLHKDRVQAIRFHPNETFTLLSGSADCTVRVNDSRAPKSASHIWRFENEIEKVMWVLNEDNYFLCTDDDGYIHLNDRRVEEKSMTSVQVGEESSPALMGMSSIVPGLLVTVAEENDIVKIWDLDVNKSSVDMVAYKKVKLGSINCIESSPDSGFVFTFGGTKSTSPLVWDLREMDEVRERFYPRLGIKEQEEEKEEARAKEERISKRQARAQKFKEIKANRFNPGNNNPMNNRNFSNKPTFRPNKSTQHFNKNNNNKQNNFNKNTNSNSNKRSHKN